MKKVFTLSLFALLTVSLSFAQGFEPPAGSTYNADSTEITLPSAYLGSIYNEAIVFDLPESFPIELDGNSYELPFSYAQITDVSTPSGMVYTCSAMSCYFEPNTSGDVALSGVPSELGLYELNLSALISINAAPIGLDLDIDINIPYTGGNFLLDQALGGDYSILNDVVPTFFLNVEPALSGCTDSTACNFHQYASIDDGTCIYADNSICEACSGEFNGTGVVISLGDTDGDGVCDFNEIIGCTDNLACNYDSTSTTDTDNSLCNYLTDFDDCATCSGEIDGTGVIIDNDFDDDGVCDEVDYDDGIGIDELSQDSPTLIRMIDILGAEHAVHPKGKLMFYIYSDGSIKKEIQY